MGNNPHLQDDGSILDASTDDPSGFGGFKIVSWDGVTTWSYTESRSTYHPHHDFTRVFNKKLNAYTVLYIATVASIGTLTSFTDTDPVRLSRTQGFYRVSLAP